MGTITYIIWTAVLCLHLVFLYKNANQFGEKFTLYNSSRRQGRSSLNITAVLVFSLIDLHGSKSRVASHWGKKEGKREKKGEKKKWKKKNETRKEKNKTPCHSLFTINSFLSFSLIYSSHGFSSVSLFPKLSFPELRLLFSLMAHSSLRCIIECHLSHFNTNSLVKSNLTSS